MVHLVSPELSLSETKRSLVHSLGELYNVINGDNFVWNASTVLSMGSERGKKSASKRNQKVIKKQVRIKNQRVQIKSLKKANRRDCKTNRLRCKTK